MYSLFRKAIKLPLAKQALSLLLLLSFMISMMLPGIINKTSATETEWDAELLTPSLADEAGTEEDLFNITTDETELLGAEPMTPPLADEAGADEDLLNDMPFDEAGAQEDLLNDMPFDEAGAQEDLLNDMPIDETGTDALLMALARTEATVAEEGNQFNADSGIFADVSNLTAWSNNEQRTVGGTGRAPIVFNNAQTTGGWKPVSEAGLDNADAFQIAFSTLGYGNIRFTCTQKSTGSGPDAFLLAYSIYGPEGPYTTIPGSETGTNGIPAITRMSNDTYGALQPSYDHFPLPSEIDNQAEVYLRVVFNGLTTLGQNGNTSINDIFIVGDEAGSGVVVNKTALTALIAQASEKGESDYTAASWAVFAAAYSHAQAVAGDGDATQASVNAARLALQNAMGALQIDMPGGEVKAPSQWGVFIDSLPNNIAATFTADPKTTCTITWQTGKDIPGEVMIGKVSYPAATLAIGNKNHHRVDLTGLTPGTSYTYVCGTSGAYSKAYTFTTEAANSVPFSIIHVTDPQIGASGNSVADATTWKRVMEAAIAMQPNPAFVVNTGDVVENMDEAKIPFYFDYAQEILASNPFVYSMGNNDSLAWYNRYFYTPSNGPLNETYSFTYGNALFVNIDSNVSGLANNAEFMAWLENTLSSSTAAWKVILMHQGFFGRSASPNAITDMFYQYGVDLALIGHNHFYYRSYPIDGRGNRVESGGIVWSLPQSAGNKQNETATNRPDIAMNSTPGPMFSTFDFSGDTLVFKAYTVNAQGATALYDTYTFAKGVKETEGPVNTPTHITAARGETDDSIGFAWYSGSAASANVSPLVSVVQIAKKSDMAGNEFPVAKSAAYSGLPTAASTGKYSNKVSVRGLDANTEYVYSVGNGTSNNWSGVGSFKTGGGAGSAFSFLYASDAQTASAAEGNVWKNTFDKALANHPYAAFMVHTGDQVETASDETHYDAFFTPQQSLLSLPLMPLTGNHDRANQFGWHFNVPQNGAAGIQGLSRANYWYRYGDALFLVLDQSSNITTQITWMRGIVAANPSQWVIVSFHETIYGVYGRAPTNRDALNAAFAELNVDLVLQGHDHTYMRTYIMRNGAAQDVNMVDGYCVDPGGTLILDIGGAASKQYAARSESWAEVYRNGEPMYAVIDVTPDTLSVNAYTANSAAAFDTFAIKKTSSGAITKDTFLFDPDIHTITGYIGLGGNLAVPSQIDGVAVLAIGIGAFERCTNLTGITIPNGVISIEESAFENCSTLARVSLPGSVKSIGKSAFEDCASLASIILPEGLESIGVEAFFNCANLERVTIPDSIISIGESAFRGCWSLTSVELPGGIEYIGYGAFDGLQDTATIQVGDLATKELVTASGFPAERIILVTKISKGDLTAAIKTALAKNEQLYTTGSWSVFSAAFRTSLLVYFNDDATQEQIDMAAANLLSAMNKLVAKVNTKVKCVGASASASIKKLTGYYNTLTITIIKRYSDGSTNTIKTAFMIKNNAAGTYPVGNCKVYVDTKGTDQIRECEVVDIPEAA